MRNFLKRNKMTIICIFSLFVIIFSYICRVSAYTYESLDFKYGKVKTKTSLNIRCGPGTNYNKVGKLRDGDYLDIFAKMGDWYIVQTNDNIIGTVSCKYIEPIYNEDEVNQFKQLNSIQNTKDENSTQTSTNIDGNGEYIDNLELTQEENEFLKLINSNRKNNGLEELRIDNAIQNVARLKAQDLERNDYFSHQSPSYGNISEMLTSFGVKYNLAQENIAGNQTLSGAIEAWMNSDNHKSNILNKDFNYTGVAVIESQTYGKIFVEVFVKK